MTSPLPTEVERLAQQATDLTAFSGINLVKTRADTEEALSHFGRLGIFQQYTKHDMTHIDGMLKLYTWLIPDDTKARMSPADWLLLTLSTYFHDFALLVTQNEFDRRAQSSFPAYVARFADARDPESRDYRVRVNAIEERARDRFLYQEFVRENHARRIRSWLVAKPDESLGFDPDVVAHIRASVGDLEPTFLKDLALVCESHHLDDLNNTAKYPVDRPYGATDAETANVQYAAIMLRTADLLHITSDRAPSVALRFINPTDPVSQIEWSKQNAVRTVRAAPSKTQEGVIDRSAPRETIEVHAEFTDENGFFGLTSYLQYADREVRQNYRWVAASNAELDVPHRYPWRSVNTDNVIADGFIASPFEFQIDQYRVLELLTGHTLYNDTNVVVREIVQNAIDAVRLKASEPNHHPDWEPTVEVYWRPEERILEVIDNGTGMTQAIIENNFLRVGSSRYQEPQFKRDHPDFTPISRFGIGVLSTFMVADEVRVVTSSEVEHKARELTLRSVHGRYLIRLLDKRESTIPDLSRKHGTSVRMRIRPSADLRDIEQILRYWIVVPRCRVVFHSSPKASSVEIGYASVEEAMRAETDLQYGGQEVDVRYRAEDGFNLAYMVRWNDYFKQWSLVSSETNVKGRIDSRLRGTCVEGIRVTTYPPGYMSDGSLCALVDVVGNDRIRTNVARTAIDPSAAYDTLAGGVYSCLGAHVSAEVTALHTERGFSATRAGREANYLVEPIAGNIREQSDALERVLGSIPAYLVESLNERRLNSLLDLERYEELAILEGPVARHTEHFLSSIPTTATFASLLASTGLPPDLATGAPLLCNWSPSSLFGVQMMEKWEIAQISPKLKGDALEVRLRPRRVEDAPRWARLASHKLPIEVRRILLNIRRSRSTEFFTKVWALNSGVNIEIDPNFEAVKLGNEVLLLDACPLLHISTIDPERVSRFERLHLSAAIYALMVMVHRSQSISLERRNRTERANWRGLGAVKIREIMAQLSEAGAFSILDQDSTFEAINSFEGRTYDTWRSQRHDLL